MSPLKFFRIVAVAEACTWALLLIGMFLKYVTETTELGVRIGGMLHGVVFIAFLLTTLVVGVDQKWKHSRIALGLASAIPPFFTIWFDTSAEKRGDLGSSWRLATEQPTDALEKVAARIIRKPLQGVAVGVLAVAVLTAVALVVGPPVG